MATADSQKVRPSQRSDLCVMKIILIVSDRFNSSIELRNEDGQIIKNITAPGDIFCSLYELLPRTRNKLRAVKSVEVHYDDSSSWTGVRSAFALSNALLYSLGLKKVEDLVYPQGPLKFYPREFSHRPTIEREDVIC